MRKLIFTALLFIATIPASMAQCVIVPQSIADRVAESKLIVEGIAGVQHSIWNSQQTMIYTINHITITKIYKGSEMTLGNQIGIISEGGQVGDMKIKVEPAFEVEPGDKGIFFITLDATGQFIATAGPQGIIRYDMVTGTAADVFYRYSTLADAESQVKTYTQQEPVITGDLGKVKKSSKRASPSITSISPKTLTAGNNISLTIKGSNFGSLQDTSSVQFKNGDDGGATYVKALKYDYVSWTDTQIVVKVRTKAGTGKPRVVIHLNGTTVASDTLKISYSHLNVISGDTLAYESRHIGLNGPGIIWKLNKKFNDSTAAKGAFMRSLERWRCGTYINWDTSGVVSKNLVASDGINLALWDTASLMPSGVLAQCFSYWSGCFVSGKLNWYVNELDIRFRVKPTNTTTWSYTGTTTPGNKFDFETVATHELGHGHQLGHVINSNEVMHYAVANGQTKRNLSTGDVAGGNYVMGKSTSSVCSKTGMTILTNGNCALVTPLANFGGSKLSPCLGETITFTDSSKGTISAYSWDFGTGAVPATANTVGPHNVKYTTAGKKTVTLTVTTPAGDKVKTAVDYIDVKADAPAISAFTWAAGGKNNVSFTNASVNATSYKWYFGDGDSATSTNASHTYPASGTYSVKLRAGNSCNNKDTTVTIKFSQVNFYVSNTTPCMKERVVFFDSSDNNIQLYSWNFGANATPSGATGKGPHAVTFNAAGAVDVKLEVVTNDNKLQSYTKTAYINTGSSTWLKASILTSNGGNNIINFYSNSTGTATDYKWYFGDGDSSADQNPVHHYSSNPAGKMVRLVVQGPCNTDDTTITLADYTKITQVLDNKLIVLQPNPAKDYFQVLPYFSGTATLVITAVTGQVVMEKQMQEGMMLNVPTENFGKGVYVVSLIRNGAAICKHKLVVE